MKKKGGTYTTWYYFNSSGAQLFGWQKIGGKWYFFQYGWGGMATGAAWDEKAEKMYLFTDNGVWRSGFTGWYSESWIDDEDGTKSTIWFYFKKGVGVNGWQKISNTWYCFDDGWMITNDWAYDSSGAYWMGSNGKITKNAWIYDYYEEEWLYMDSHGQPACNKWVKDSAGWYYMNDYGYITRNDWAKDSKGWYWMGEDGHYVTDTTITWEGEEYTFGSDGICLNPPF